MAADLSAERFKRASSVSVYDGQRGPNGNRLCRQCGKETKNKRTTFCGDECVQAWRIERWPSEQRAAVLKRDAGVCASCSLDCLALEKDLTGLSAALFTERVLALCIPANRAGVTSWGRPWVGSLWDMDHITPVVEGGGGACGLDNFQTLCWACHQRKTAEHATRRAEQRKASCK